MLDEMCYGAKVNIRKDRKILRKYEITLIDMTLIIKKVESKNFL